MAGGLIFWVTKPPIKDPTNMEAKRICQARSDKLLTHSRYGKVPWV